MKTSKIVEAILQEAVVNERVQIPAANAELRVSLDTFDPETPGFELSIGIAGGQEVEYVAFGGGNAVKMDSAAAYRFVSTFATELAHAITQVVEQHLKAKSLRKK